jgi:hypothetical protein
VLTLGDDKFVYRVEDLSSTAANGYNVPKAFDASLLKVGPDDFARPEAVHAPIAAPVAPLRTS